MKAFRRNLGGTELNLGVLFSLLVLAGILVAAKAGVFERLELASQTARLQLRGRRKSPTKIAIILLGDRETAAWDEPTIFWGKHLASVLEKCSDAGASAIGVDMVLSGDPDDFLDKVDPSGTAERPMQALAQAIQDAHGKVVLSNFRDAQGRPINPSGYLLSLPELENRLGFVDLATEADGTVRRVPLYRESGALRVPGFAALLASIADPKAPSTASSDSVWINPVGAEPSLLSGSMVANMDREQLAALMKGALVLIGVSYSGSQDFHRDSMGSIVPGVWIQADGVSTILDRRPLARFGAWAEVLLTGLCGLFALVLASLFSARLSISGLIGFAVVWLGTAQWLFVARDFVIPVAAPITTLVLIGLSYYASHGLEESFSRLRLQALFGRFLSVETAAYLTSESKGLEMGGEIVEATILFFDVRGSTRLAEALGPEEIVARLNDLYKVVIPAVESRHGFINNFAGDGFMAVFGALGDSSNHCQSAVDAALDILARVSEMNNKLPSDKRWEVGMGIHTGPVLQGNIGDEHRSAFTFMGDTVNVASRLESLCKDSGSPLFVSADLAAKATLPVGRFAGPLDERLKGRSDSLLLYYLTKETSAI